MVNLPICGPPAANRPHAAGKSARKRQKPWEVQTAVRDLVSTTETLIGQTGWSKALVRHGLMRWRCSLAKVLGVRIEDVRVRDRPD